MIAARAVVVACAAASLAGCSRLAPRGPTWGTANPYRLVATPPDGRWAVVCQARADTDHDGKIYEFYEFHGEDGGDALVAYLESPDGHETIVDNVLASDPSGHWLAVVERGAPVLIDTLRWQRTPLVGTLPRFRIDRGMVSWSFSPDGSRLLYWRDDTPIVRELASGREIEIAPHAWTAKWNPDSGSVALEILGGDTNHDGFTHGPNLEPGEGIPGQSCGHKRDWGDRMTELLPGDQINDTAKMTAMFASLETSDDLALREWRVSDGTLADARAIGPDCEIASRFGASLVVRCMNEHEVRWLGAAGERELYRGNEYAGVTGEDTGFFAVWVENRLADGRVDDSNLFFDARTGQALPIADSAYHEWSDADHLVVALEDRPGATHRTAQLFTRGKPTPLTVPAGEVRGPSGQFLAIGERLIRLDTLEVQDLGVEPVAVRDDGAILVDGGPQTKDPTEHWRMGPLRWVAP